MKVNLNIDSRRVDIGGFRSLVAALTQVCEEQGLPWFVVGALARDLLLEHVHGIAAPRATRDVDIAVAVSGWAEYEALSGALIGGYGYARCPEPHRLRSDEQVLVDLIPYGDIEAPPGQVGWPPDQDFMMTTLGFEEAYASAVVLTIDRAFSLRVTSLAGVGVLKLVAWAERPQVRQRDAEDLCFIMRQYYDVVGDALYVDHLDLFDEEPFDRDRASARIYGRAMGALLRLSRPLRERVLEVLRAQVEDEMPSPLVVAMGTGCMPDYAKRFGCLQALQVGVVDVVG